MKRIAYFLMAVLTVASVVSCADQATTDNGTVTKSDDAVAAETDAVTEEPSARFPWRKGSWRHGLYHF